MSTLRSTGGGGICLDAVQNLPRPMWKHLFSCSGPVDGGASLPKFTRVWWKLTQQALTSCSPDATMKKEAAMGSSQLHNTELKEFDKMDVWTFHGRRSCCIARLVPSTSPLIIMFHTLFTSYFLMCNSTILNGCFSLSSGSRFMFNPK